jgi:uncharacterized membrane protein
VKRLNSLDILRALAIIFMVQVHFVGNLSYWFPAQAALYDLSFLFGGLAAPSFTLLVGASLWISTNRRRANGVPERTIAARTVRRALAIFVVGLIFNLIIWGPEELFDWDILTFIGSVLVVVYVAGRLPGWAIAGLCAAILATSPPLRELTGYGSHWLSERGNYTEYIVPWRADEILLGYTLQGYFPLLPWLVFPLAGYASARHLLGAEEGLRKRRARSLLAVGGALALLGLGAHLAGSGLERPLGFYLSPSTFYPASTSFVLLTLGLVLAGLAGLWLALDSSEARRAAVSRRGWMVFFGRYSRYALTIYVLHHAVHLWPLYVAGLAQGDVWTYWQDWVTPAGALGLAALFLAACYVVLVGWDKLRQTGSLEWLLARAVS